MMTTSRIERSTIQGHAELSNATIDQFLEHLENTCIPFEEFACYVALTEDKTTIFVRPMKSDGTAERDKDNLRHMNWIQVTAPEPAFLERVNKEFGASFEYEKFSGR